MGFLPKYLSGYSHPDAVARNTEYAVRSTQWLVAQFFGWTEILRREVQFLDLGSLERNRKLVFLQERVREAFATDRGGLSEHFRLSRAEQRALGELMIEECRTTPGRSECMGYAGFLARMSTEDDAFAKRVLPREGTIHALATIENPDRRVIEIQRSLIDLIDFLDDDRSRFPLDLRGKLPLEKPLTPVQAIADLAEADRPPRLARFRFGSEPWDYIDAWAKTIGYASAQSRSNGEYRVYRKHRKPRLRVSVFWNKGWIEIDGEVEARGRGMDGALRTSRPEDPGIRHRRLKAQLRHDVNVLLHMFDRPLIRTLPRRRRRVG